MQKVEEQSYRKKKKIPQFFEVSPLTTVELLTTSKNWIFFFFDDKIRVLSQVLENTFVCLRILLSKSIF